MERKELGQILLEKGLITQEQLEDALLKQTLEKKFLGEILIEQRIVTKEQIIECLTDQKKSSFVDLSKIRGIKAEVVNLIPENIARRYNLIAIALEKDKLTIAMADPTDIVAIDTVRRNTNKQLRIVRAEKSQIEEFVEKYYGVNTDLSRTTSELEETGTDTEVVNVQQLKVAAEDPPIVKFVNSLFLEATEKRATDIHLEPQEDKISLRFRIDGALYHMPPPPRGAYSGIVTRLKILSNLDIGERRLPQDGRTKFRIGPREIDVRVSTLPTIYGEKIVLRLLHKQSLVKTLDTLGMEEEEANIYRSSLKKPYGMIIVTGPTGSGKTTTLYSGLNFINTPEKNIITIEDPVEYELAGINQVQVKPKIGLTFAEVLRSILRQDPDVIMVGEIRDLETAQISIQSALTGHLVISTLHTNDTISTVARLNYMGIPNYLIVDAVHLIMAQRLVRRICQNCLQEDIEGTEILKNMGIKVENKIYKGRGCGECNSTGYKGMIAIFEVLNLNKGDIKKQILKDTDEEALRELCIKYGFTTLKQAALKKVFAGITTVEELLSKTLT
ncbi:MAG: ATPase, T2SS/T4P/T4SS family [bacterium]|nr:ATPase, T2SS/T4P/T4SS family [bacterium]